MITQHKEFDLQTQLKLDRLWESWSQYDAVCAQGGYENEARNKRLDACWEQYQTALDTAYRALASAEADEIVARHGDSIRRQIGAAGYRQLSRNLTAVSQQLAVQYTSLDLRKYYRQSTTLRPSIIGREEVLQHITEERLAELEARAAKNGIARINTLSDHEISVTVVK